MTVDRVQGIDGRRLRDALRQLVHGEPPTNVGAARLALLAARTLHTSSAVVSLSDDEKDLLISRFWTTNRSSTTYARPASDRSFCRLVVDQSQVLIVDDADAHPLGEDNWSVSDLGVRAYLGVPLVAADGYTVGTFGVVDRQPRKWTEDDCTLVIELGAAVLAELEHQAVIRQTERRVVRQQEELRDRLASLAEALGTARDLLSVFRTLREFTAASAPCNGLFVSLYDPERQERECVYAWSEGEENDVSGLPRLPLTDSPNSRAIVTREVVVVDDYQTAIAGKPSVLLGMDINPRLPQSALVAPMVVADRVLGAVTIQSVEPAAYGAEHVGVIRLAANLAAVAIENVRHLHGEQLARAEAERALRKRDEFLSVAAHELKTPVTSMRGFAQLLLRQLDRSGTMDEARVRQALQVIDEQSERLSRLVSQLVDATHIDVGKLVLERKPVDLVQLVAGVIAKLPSSGKHTVRLQAPTELMALIDPLRVEQVLVSLIDNAIRFSPDGGVVEVTLALTTADSFHLAVTDHGLGIPHEHRPFIFERFYQGHAAGQFGGLGLGLYTSRAIVVLHGGQLAVEFPPEGGTRFVVRLPVGFR